MKVTGTIIRFDGIRGYGFISPDIGGEDIFLHVNDLQIEKSRAKPGTRVSFEVEEGERGKIANNVRLASSEMDSNLDIQPIENASAAHDEYFDVLTIEEFRNLATEILLQIQPSLLGDQIVAVRNNLEKLGHKHGWIEP